MTKRKDDKGEAKSSSDRPNKKSKKAPWQTIELLQFIIRSKMKLDEYYNTESVESDAMHQIFRNMNDYYHKALYPKGMKYPCGSTNRMTLLQYFPVSSTSTDKSFFERKMNDFIDKHSTEYNKLLAIEMEERRKKREEIQNGSFTESDDSVSDDIEEYNNQHKKLVRERQPSSKAKNLSPIFKKAMEDIMSKGQEYKKELEHMELLNSTTLEEKGPELINTLPFNNKIEMFKLITENIKKDRESLNVEMKCCNSLLIEMQSKLNHIATGYQSKIDKLKDHIETLKKEQKEQSDILEEGIKLLNTGIKNNTIKITEKIQEEEELVIQELQKHVNCL
jgi:ferritin-like metal-binding protein YciE